MKPTFAASIALLALVAASHAAPPASQPAKPAEFGIGWTGTLKGAVCVRAHVEKTDDASLVSVRDANGAVAGQVLLIDHPFIGDLADGVAVPAKYADTKILVTGTSEGFRRQYLVAKIKSK